MIQEIILPPLRIVLSGDDNMYGIPVAVKQVRPMTHVYPVFPAIGQITSMQWASTVHGRPFTQSCNICPCLRSFGVLAQLARALASHARGRRFESVMLHLTNGYCTAYFSKSMFPRSRSRVRIPSVPLPYGGRSSAVQSGIYTRLYGFPGVKANISGYSGGYF